MPYDPRQAPHWRPRDLFLLALWAGLLTGFGEVLVLLGRKAVTRRFFYLGPDVVWTTPLVDGLLFGLLGLVLWTAARLWGGQVHWRPAFVGAAAVGCTTLLLMFNQLHRLSAVVLGAAVGVQLGRVLEGRGASLLAVVRRTLPGLVAAVLLLGAVFVGRRVPGERFQLARLAPAPAGAPSVLLIILDTVRSFNLSLYGYPRETTPELGRWAAGGVRFEQAYSPSSWTLPSHLTLLTGKHLHQLGTELHVSLRRGERTLTEALRDRGYATAGFVANERYVSWEAGISRGFLRYDDYDLSVREAIQGSLLGRRAYHQIGRYADLPELRDRRRAPRITGAFLEWVDRTDGRPFFAMLNYLDAHDPYEAPPPFAGRFGSAGAGAEPPNPDVRHTPASMRRQMAAYDESIAYLDAELGRLFAELERRGVLDNTIVVLTSDHGEAFGENGLVLHGSSLYRGMVQVPLVIAWPGRVPAGAAVADPVSLRDVPATIADLVGLGSAGRFPGRSLARYWRDGGRGAADTVVSFVRQEPTHPDWWPVSRGDIAAIQFDGMRYVRNLGDHGEELFDAAADPLEQRDLSRTPRGTALLPRYRAALASVLERGTPAWRERASAALAALRDARAVTAGSSPRPSRP